MIFYSFDLFFFFHLDLMVFLMDIVEIKIILSPKLVKMLKDCHIQST